MDGRAVHAPPTALALGVRPSLIGVSFVLRNEGTFSRGWKRYQCCIMAWAAEQRTSPDSRSTKKTPCGLCIYKTNHANSR